MNCAGQTMSTSAHDAPHHVDEPNGRVAIKFRMLQGDHVGMSDDRSDTSICSMHVTERPVIGQMDVTGKLALPRSSIIPEILSIASKLLMRAITSYIPESNGSHMT